MESLYISTFLSLWAQISDLETAKIVMLYLNQMYTYVMKKKKSKNNNNKKHFPLHLSLWKSLFNEHNDLENCLQIFWVHYK